MQEENKPEQDEAKKSMIMPGPYPPYPPPPPPPITHQWIKYSYWIGDVLEVVNIGYTGVVTMVATDQEGHNHYVLDNGKEDRWYAESLVRPVATYQPQPYRGPCFDDKLAASEDKG
jgi:hypothetical protein